MNGGGIETGVGSGEAQDRHARAHHNQQQERGSQSQVALKHHPHALSLSGLADPGVDGTGRASAFGHGLYDSRAAVDDVARREDART